MQRLNILHNFSVCNLNHITINNKLLSYLKINIRGNFMSSIEQHITILKKGNLEMMTACFDEYYFIIPEQIIKPDSKNSNVYSIGDELPIKGDTYEFPKDFNIIDLHFKKVAKIRDGKLYDIIAVEEYEYDEIPAFNMMGFSINLNSKNDYDEYKNDFNSFRITEREKLAAFANKWFNIVKYRRIKYK